MKIRATYLAFACGLALFSASPLAAQSVTEFAPPSENLTQLQARVTELERLLQQATDQTERAQVEVRRLKADNERLQRLLDDAQRQRASAGAPLSAVASDDPLADASPAPTLAAAPKQAPPQQGAAPKSPTSLGTIPASEAPPTSAAEAFKAAQRLVAQSKFAEAEEALAAFVRAYPDSSDLAEARYWLGRTQIVRGRHNEAAQTFVELLRESPSSPRAADAWIRVGVALRNMGQQAQACTTFKDFFENYPEASAPLKKFARDQARVTGCPQ